MCRRGPRIAGTAALAALLVVLQSGPAGPAQASAETIEHIRGIYLQQTIELARVGSRTIRLTRMTRFRRCGRLRAVATDFNHHLVEVVGREVEGIGFVAGVVDAIEGCSSAVARRHGLTE